MSVILPPFWHPACKKAFILDWDGVLADTKLDFSGIRRKYFDGRTVPLIESANAFPTPLGDEVKEEIRKIEMEGADKARPVEGAFDLLNWLEAEKKSWAVVSRNCRDSIELAAQRCGIRLPEVVLSRESAAVKPDPEAFRLAAKLMDESLNDCVMVGDFIYDILGARRASLRCVLVECKKAEWASLADVGYPTLKDFVSVLQKKPSPLVPWEYRDLTEQRSKKYLESTNRYVWQLPADEVLSWAIELAKLGVIKMALPADVKLSVEEWKNSYLPAEAIDRPLFEVLNDFLKAHWPCVSVVSSEELEEDAHCISLKKLLLGEADDFLQEIIDDNEDDLQEDDSF